MATTKLSTLYAQQDLGVKTSARDVLEILLNNIFLSCATQLFTEVELSKGVISKSATFGGWTPIYLEQSVQMIAYK